MSYEEIYWNALVLLVYGDCFPLGRGSETFAIEGRGKIPTQAVVD